MRYNNKVQSEPGIPIGNLFALVSATAERPKVSPAYNLSSLRFLESIHRRRSDALKLFINENGWPGAALFGEEIEKDAFLIVLHSDYDPDFQMRCHQLMLQLAKHGKLRLGYLACLTDRILCNLDKHQRFGTQIREVTNGCFVPKPIEDPDHVDELRAQVGIAETLADYLQRINSGDLVFFRPVLDGEEEKTDTHEEKIISFPKQTH